MKEVQNKKRVNVEKACDKIFEKKQFGLIIYRKWQEHKSD